MAKAVLSAVDKSARASNIASAVSAGADIAGVVISTIAGVSDQKKRAIYQANLDALTLDQQAKLNKLMLDANSETERLSILAQTLSSANTQRINNIVNMYTEAEKKKRNQQLLVAGGILLLGLAAVIIIIKKA